MIPAPRWNASTWRSDRSRVACSTPSDPAEDISGVNKRGGFQVSMQQADGLAQHGLAKYQVKKTDEIRIALKDISAVGQGRGQYHYFVSLEDAARIKNPADSTRGQVVTDVQILRLVSAENTIASPWRTYDELKTGSPVPFGVIETFHRTANTSVGGQPVADLIYTTNPRNPSINHQLATGSFTVAPHFQSTLRTTPRLTMPSRRASMAGKSFWGPSHSSSGKSQLPFFEIPRQPLLSLAAFQHADLSSSTFAPANQFGNSWASAYLGRNKAGCLKPGASQLPEVPIYDSRYLTNEALWDGCFFSGAAPRLKPASGGKPSTAWDQPIASVQQSLEEVRQGFRRLTAGQAARQQPHAPGQGRGHQRKTGGAPARSRRLHPHRRQSHGGRRLQYQFHRCRSLDRPAFRTCAANPSRSRRRIPPPGPSLTAVPPLSQSDRE